MKDLFSGHASDYARFRPTYPAALYEWVLAQVENFECAWDYGTGNGQVAQVLAKYFVHVEATDISAAQMQAAPSLFNVNYQICPAELTPFAPASFDLITVGQALHWLDFEQFNTEVKRVAKPNATVAVWGYGTLQISPEIDEIVDDFYHNVVGMYWEKERRHVENQYADIPFPYRQVEKQVFANPYEWTLAQLCQYFNTWSSVKKYEKVVGKTPIATLSHRLAKVWGEQSTQTVTFPVFALLGRV